MYEKEKADTKTARGFSPQSVMYLPNEVEDWFRDETAVKEGDLRKVVRL